MNKYGSSNTSISKYKYTYVCTFSQHINKNTYKLNTFLYSNSIKVKR
jgi:hypothetical protein